MDYMTPRELEIVRFGKTYSAGDTRYPKGKGAATMGKSGISGSPPGELVLICLSHSTP